MLGTKENLYIPSLLIVKGIAVMLNITCCVDLVDYPSDVQNICMICDITKDDQAMPLSMIDQAIVRSPKGVKWHH